MIHLRDFPIGEGDTTVASLTDYTVGMYGCQPLFEGKIGPVYGWARSDLQDGQPARKLTGSKKITHMKRTMEGMPRAGKLKVIVVGTEGLYRDLLSISMSNQPNIEVVGAFADPAAALDAAEQLSPDVAILDIDSGSSFDDVQTGLLLRERLPNIGIVLLSTHHDPRRVAALPPHDLRGWSYLLKSRTGDLQALCRAVEGASAGLVVMDRRSRSR